MADETTTTTLNDLTQSAIAEARMTLSQGILLSDLVSKRPLPKGHNAVSFPLYGAATHSAVAEATDLANQAISTSTATITPGEYGSMTTLTDVAAYASQAQVGTDLGRLFGEAHRDAVNQAIYALFDGFSTAIGTTNTNITVALLDEAVRQLRINKAPPPYYFVTTPHVMRDLVGLYAAVAVANVSTLSQMAQEKGMLPPFHGVVPIIIDNLAAGTGAGGIDEADTKSGVFSSAAIGMAVGYDFTVVTQRDESMRGVEIIGKSYWAVGELNDTYGIEVLLDNKD